LSLTPKLGKKGRFSKVSGRDKMAENNLKENKPLIFENGKIYFSKETERKFYFLLTLIMLIAGILYKVGLFQ